MNQPYPLISIITLNFNQTKVTCEFLKSCEKLSYRNYEILVCDMNSDEDPSPLIHEGHYLNTTLYRSDKNLGFAGGNNWGISFAKGDYFLIINNDTEITENLIEMLLIPFQIDSTTGVVSPKIKYFDNDDLIQYAGFTQMNHFTGRTRTLGNKEKDRGQFDEIKITCGAHGAAMMVKREVVDKVGRFPEKFFLYYEEWDWCSRILNAGYKIYFQGLATVYHKESVSVGKLNPMKEYYLTRNRILYMRRNSRGIRLLIFSLFFTFFTFPKTVVRLIVRGNYAHLKAFLRGVRDNLTMSSYSPV